MTFDLVAVAEHISRKINILNGGSWADVGRYFEEDTQWATDLLSRVSLLVGDSQIEYSSGQVEHGEEDNTYTGEIVVFTTSSIVLANFSLKPGDAHWKLVLDLKVSSSRRDSVISVTALGVRTSNDGKLTRPSVNVELANGKVLALPTGKRPLFPDDPDLVDFASKILVPPR